MRVWRSRIQNNPCLMFSFLILEIKNFWWNELKSIFFQIKYSACTSQDSAEQPNFCYLRVLEEQIRCCCPVIRTSLEFDNPWVSLSIHDILILWLLLAASTPQPATGMGDLEAQKAGLQLRQNWWHPESHHPFSCANAINRECHRATAAWPTSVLWQTLLLLLPLPGLPWEETILMVGPENLRSAPSLPTNSPRRPVNPSFPPGAGKQPHNLVSFNLHG